MLTDIVLCQQERSGPVCGILEDLMYVHAKFALATLCNKVASIEAECGCSMVIQVGCLPFVSSVMVARRSCYVYCLVCCPCLCVLACGPNQLLFLKLEADCNWEARTEVVSGRFDL